MLFDELLRSACELEVSLLEGDVVVVVVVVVAGLLFIEDELFVEDEVSVEEPVEPVVLVLEPVVAGFAAGCCMLLTLGPLGLLALSGVPVLDVPGPWPPAALPVPAVPVPAEVPAPDVPVPAAAPVPAASPVPVPPDWAYTRPSDATSAAAVNVLVNFLVDMSGLLRLSG